MQISLFNNLYLKSAFTLLFLLLFLSPGTVFPETDEQNNIRIYKERSPGVVNILTLVVTYDFFLNPIPLEGVSGSGVIIDRKGHILTNSHVIEKAERLTVTLMDGSTWDARVIGVDPKTDLAVIKVDAQPNLLNPIPFSRSKNLLVGTKVLAIGNPFGLTHTMTTGIISSIGRNIKTEDGGEMENIIQTDASINPGNSGGPLLNTKGDMIGINTAIFSPSGGSVGIGFAIPADRAREVAEELIEKGYVSYPVLGVELVDITPAMSDALSLPVSYGMLIATVYQKGPADAAGLKGGTRTVRFGNTLIRAGGDIIIGADDEEIRDFSDYKKFINRHKPGDLIHIALYRDGKKLKLKVVLGEEGKEFNYL